MSVTTRVTATVSHPLGWGLQDAGVLFAAHLRSLPIIVEHVAERRTGDVVHLGARIVCASKVEAADALRQALIATGLPYDAECVRITHEN